MVMKKVLLLSMPFGALERQALGLSIFKARLEAEGIPCDIRYLTFAFADLIGVEEYCWLSTELPHTAFVGEWLFTPCLYGPNTHSQTLYLRSVVRTLWGFDDSSIDRIKRAQAMTPHFMEYCLQSVPWDDYALVGFTSTFEQNIASLALARRLKVEHPHLKIAFGGANWEGEMGLELHRRFPFVDFACSGEADESFPMLAKLLLAGRLKGKARAAIPGLIYRSRGKTAITTPPEPVYYLDALPIPDYGDYFRDFDRSSASTYVVPTLLFETARGCWWGEKRHCMFCGLNGATMSFRAKSSQRALQEINHLVHYWKIDTVQAVDNVVPMNYFRDFFPTLANAEWPVKIFYEIRANLSRKQVKKLRDAGVLHVQPGIESLSNHVLDLMRKGTTALQNIQLLKWCQEYGVKADYNLLYGFPGETDEDYRELFKFLRAVRFLNPPTGCGPIRLDRFSPYFIEAKAHGLVNVRPISPYYYLYPFCDESVRRIAYYFDYDLRPSTMPLSRSSELLRWVEDWKVNPERGTLKAFDRPDGSLALLDTRSQAVRSSVILKGVDKAVYDYCDSVRSLAAICDYLARTFPERKFRQDAIRGFLDAMVANGFIVSDDSHYLSLALRSQPVESTSGLAASKKEKRQSVSALEM
jgi:ribosomal peptide maturation radical SAM protein 1